MVEKITYIVDWDDYDWREFETLEGAMMEAEKLRKKFENGWVIRIIKQTREIVHVERDATGVVQPHMDKTFTAGENVSEMRKDDRAVPGYGRQSKNKSRSQERGT